MDGKLNISENESVAVVIVDHIYIDHKFITYDWNLIELGFKFNDGTKVTCDQVRVVGFDMNINDTVIIIK